MADRTRAHGQAPQTPVYYITTAVTLTVTLGQGSYGDIVTVTDAGSVVPVAAGATAVYGDGPTVELINDGTIAGGAGAASTTVGGAGGIGVVLAEGLISNSGSISGGAGGSCAETGGAGGTGVALNGANAGLSNNLLVAGGNGYGSLFGVANGGAGGAGVVLEGGPLSNTGTITGGNGGYGEKLGGAGGTGLVMDGGTATNDVLISGGLGGGDEDAATQSGVGGDGVSLSSGTLTNDGKIAGGGPRGSRFGTQGGAGVAMTGGTLINTATVTGGGGGLHQEHPGQGGAGVSISGGTLSNTGTIAGGYDGGTGMAVSNAVVSNTGEIYGAVGAYPAGIGGVGVSLDGGSLTNGGSIYGGEGGHNGSAIGALGGNGVAMSSGQLSNTGTIGGGDGGNAHEGGAGVSMSGGTLTNQAFIVGGGAGEIIGVSGADGGAGVQLSGGLLINHASITGGTGTFENFGGAGVSISGALAINYGTITGGEGEEGQHDLPGRGGAGAYLNGGTLENAGTISGGVGNPPFEQNLNGDAVQFGSLAGTLVVDAGAVFTGLVVADASAADVLELGGTVPGALGGIGPEFSNFSTFDFAAGAAWAVEGTIGALAGGQAIEGFAVGDSIVLDDFAETGSLYVVGTGLELDGASGSETLSIKGNFTTQDFAVATNGTNSVVELGNVISTAVSSSVTLGQGGYGDALIVTDTGSVRPIGVGATGVTGTGSLASLYTMGYVFGGPSSAANGNNGGAGVSFIGGTITNAGDIQGYRSGYGGIGGTGVSLTGGLILNTGTISGGNGGGASSEEQPGAGGTGVLLDGGTLANDAGGRIYGGRGGIGDPATGAGGVAVSIESGTVSNQGTVEGGLGGGTGVFVSATAALSNSDTGTISGGSGGYGAGVGSDPTGTGGSGVVLDGGSLANAGQITGGEGGFFHAQNFGPGGSGVAMSGGTLSNTGTIAGGNGKGARQGGAGVAMSGGTLENQGLIAGGGGGLFQGEGAQGGAGVIFTGGTLLNTGEIFGGASPSPLSGGMGVSIAGATLTNSGTISGGEGGAPLLGGGGQGGVGAYFNGGTLVNAGTIEGGVGDNGAEPGTAGNAVQFGSLAGTLVVEPGAVFDGAVVANAAAADVLELAGSSAATLSGLGSQFTNFSSIDFSVGAIWSVAGTTDALATGQAIEGFAAQNSIVLDNFVETGSLYVAGIGLELDRGSFSTTLDIQGDFTTQDFVVSTDGTNTTIELCYLRGTRILTPTGEVPIESIGIGDRVVTRFGAIQQVTWIGRQCYGPRTLRSDPGLLPVRIHAGALGEHLPARDLFVSPGHSMLIGDVLVLAGALVNGVTVTQELPDGCEDGIAYFQIELVAHDCIIAEGTWSETFADGPGLRDAFHNAAEFYALYPDAVPPEELVLCAHRPDRGAALQAALRPVAARAAATVTPGPMEGCLDGVVGHCRVEGWAWDLAHPHLPVLLDVLLRGERIGTTLACDFRADLLQAGKGDGRCAFAFTAPRRLTRDDCDALTIRRTADGATLPTSDAWHTARAVA